MRNRWIEDILIVIFTVALVLWMLTSLSPKVQNSFESAEGATQNSLSQSE